MFSSIFEEDILDAGIIFQFKQNSNVKIGINIGIVLLILFIAALFWCDFYRV